MSRPVAGHVVRVLAAAALAVGGIGLSGVGSASADPLGDARHRAAQLAAEVTRLQNRVEVATERYDAVEAQLGSAVTLQSLAQRQVDADEADAQSATDTVDAQIRALYESGGRATLLATVLGGSDPTDAMSRLHMLGSVLSYDSGGVAAAERTAAQARNLAARLTAAADRVTRLQHAATVASEQVQTLLASSRQALADTDKQVRHLVVQQEAAQAAASAADWQAALAAAGGSLGGGTKAPNAIAAGAIAAARTRLGVPYVWGATGPNSFDCSGLTQWAYAHVGIALPRVAADQWNAGPHVGLGDLEPGDLLFWATDVSNPATIHHVALYIGNGLMIAAPHTGTVVQVQSVYLDGYIGATRPYSSGG